MAVDSTTRRVVYAGNGKTTAFPFAFKVFNATDVAVAVGATAEGSTDLAYGTDYTVALNSDQETNPGGTVTVTTAPATGYNLAITSSVPYDQTMKLTPYDGFNPETLNDNSDRQCVQIQQLLEQVSRALITDPTDTLTPRQLRDKLLAGVDQALKAAQSASTDAATTKELTESVLAIKSQIQTVVDNIDDVKITAENAQALSVLANNLSEILKAKGYSDTAKSWAEQANAIATSQAVIAKGTTTARTLDERFADVVNVKDFGSKGDGVTDDTAAFKKLSALYKYRRINLLGHSYAVTALPNDQNFYVNGNFIVNGETVTPMQGDYRYPGAAPRYVNLRRDFTDLKRGGGLLLYKNLVRKSSSAGNVIQTAVWDDANRYIYTLHANGSNLGCIDRFTTTKIGPGTTLTANAYTAPCKYIGHQGLGLEYQNDGSVKLWASMGYIEVVGDDVYSPGSKAVRFDAPTSANQDISSSIEIFNLYPEKDKWSQSATVCTSYSGRYLIAKANVDGGVYEIRVFKTSDLTTAGDYQNKYIHAFRTNFTFDNADGSGVTRAFQGMACDDSFIYVLASTTQYENKHSIYVLDMCGNIVDEFRNLSLGKEWGKEAGATYYEPESIFFANINGSPQLVLQIATGEAGARLCHLIAVGLRSHYLFFAGGRAPNGHGLTIEDNGRVSNNQSFGLMSLYPSGLCTNQVARSGPVHCNIARFSNDEVGANFSFYKSRGTAIGASASVAPLDRVGNIYWVADNGNIDYTASTVGASVAVLGVRIAGDTTQTTDGSSNQSLKSDMIFTVSQDATERASAYISMILSCTNLRPEVDSNLALGKASTRWSELFAATATINTSDERCKENISLLEDALMRAWGKVGFKVFQFKDAVEKKGEEARIHIGVIAQEVKSAFESEGLDATRYGLFCYDKWDDEYEEETITDQEEVLDEDGNVVTPAVTHTERKLVTPAGDRYGIRYEEALALECAYQRWRLEQLEAKLG